MKITWNNLNTELTENNNNNDTKENKEMESTHTAIKKEKKITIYNYRQYKAILTRYFRRLIGIIKKRTTHKSELWYEDQFLKLYNKIIETLEKRTYKTEGEWVHIRQYIRDFV